MGVSNNNHLEAIVTGGVTDDLAYITGVPTDSLGACGFVRIPGKEEKRPPDGCVCGHLGLWNDCIPCGMMMESPTRLVQGLIVGVPMPLCADVSVPLCGCGRPERVCGVRGHAVC